VEVTIPFEGGLLRAEEDSPDMYASIDKVIDSLERQIRRNKTKLEKKVHDGSLRFENIKFDDDEVEEEPKFEVVRTKKFANKTHDG